MIEWLIDIFTMKWESSAFLDVVDGSMVHYYRDRKGKRWMKTSLLSTFKVKAND